MEQEGANKVRDLPRLNIIVPDDPADEVKCDGCE